MATDVSYIARLLNSCGRYHQIVTAAGTIVVTCGRARAQQDTTLAFPKLCIGSRGVIGSALVLDSTEPGLNPVESNWLSLCVLLENYKNVILTRPESGSQSFEHLITSQNTLIIKNVWLPSLKLSFIHFIHLRGQKRQKESETPCQINATGVHFGKRRRKLNCSIFVLTYTKK